jgi:hypothetical protein
MDARRGTLRSRLVLAILAWGFALAAGAARADTPIELAPEHSAPVVEQQPVVPPDPSAPPAVPQEPAEDSQEPAVEPQEPANAEIPGGSAAEPDALAPSPGARGSRTRDSPELDSGWLERRLQGAFAGVAYLVAALARSGLDTAEAGRLLSVRRRFAGVPTSMPRGGRTACVYAVGRPGRAAPERNRGPARAPRGGPWPASPGVGSCHGFAKPRADRPV